jgi:hypothetical protein
MKRLAVLVPAGLGVLTVALIVAVITARTERPTRALSFAAPGILHASGATPPELAAINERLQQIAALRADALYGEGFATVAEAPVASLRPILGDEWRKLGTAVGRIWVRPSNTRSPYFEVSMVAVAPVGPVRLELLTSQEQRIFEDVGAKPFQVINLGPLIAGSRAGVGLALKLSKITSAAQTPSVVLSPLQAEYLAPGQAVMSMPALAETGPTGERGVYLGSGAVARFAMTPGIAGPCSVTLKGVDVGGRVGVTVTVGSQARSAQIDRQTKAVQFGPFADAQSVIAVRVTRSGTQDGALFLSDLRFVVSPVKQK